MKYWCPKCEKLIDHPFCPDHSVKTEPRPDAAVPAVVPALPPLPVPPEPPVSAEAWQAADDAWLRDRVEEEEPVPLFDEPPPELRTQRMPESPELQRSEPPEPPPPREEILLRGERELREAYLRQGYEVYLVAGVAGSGKTQLLKALQHLQGGVLDDIRQNEDGTTVRTQLGELRAQPVRRDGRQLVFVDAAGEHFRSLYPASGSTGAGEERMDESGLAIVRLVARHLRGLILLVDLQQLWGEGSRAGGREQEKILGWIVSVLRWLRLDRDRDGQAPHRPPAIPLHRFINQRVQTLSRRLDVPVLVLFSKADELGGVVIPGQGRTLQPAGEQPFLLAHHCLPELNGALEAHADHYRYDFVHSIVTDTTTGTVVPGLPPCGVAPSVDWLLDPASGGRGIPTRRFLAWQRRLDTLTARRRRWERLPPPRRLSR